MTDACRKIIEDMIAYADLDVGGVNAPVDASSVMVKMLHDRYSYGYGDIMDAAMRLWLVADPVGALIVGPTIDAARKALAALPVLEVRGVEPLDVVIDPVARRSRSKKES